MLPALAHDEICNAPVDGAADGDLVLVLPSAAREVGTGLAHVGNVDVHLQSRRHFAQCNYPIRHRPYAVLVWEYDLRLSRQNVKPAWRFGLEVALNPGDVHA
jgi:hypothetical protein